VAHGSDRLSVALATALTTSDTGQRVSYPVTADSIGLGWSDAPDAPPPQQ
jgi:putative hemolysin